MHCTETAAGPTAPVKFTITREGATLFVRPGSQSAAPLEATTPDKFQIGGGRMVFEFDAAKKQMIQKRGAGEGFHEGKITVTKM